MYIKGDQILTEHFNIDKFGCIFEILMPDGRFLYYEFEPNHKLREKMHLMFTISNLRKNETFLQKKCPETTGSQCVRHS